MGREIVATIGLRWAVLIAVAPFTVTSAGPPAMVPIVSLKVVWFLVLTLILDLSELCFPGTTQLNRPGFTG